MTSSKIGIDRETHQTVYLPKSARTQGLYIIGIQGTGKSGLIENLIMQDIDQQIGVCVLDPHGTLVDNVISRLPDNREKVVIILDLANYAYPFGLNLFTCSDPTNPLAVQEVVDQVMHVFEKLYDVSRSTPRIAQYLRNCTHTLIANPGYTMADIPLLLADSNCRRVLLTKVSDPQVLLFWKRYELLKPSEQSEQADSILNKLEELLQPLPRNIVGQANTTIDLQEIMNKGLILLVKLSPRLPYATNLIGSLMIALLLNAAYNRPAQRKQFHLYADEFQRFATEDFATLLEEARKFGIATTIAHQTRSQLNSATSKLDTDLKDRSRSVGNIIIFKINSKDADDLAGEFNITPQEAYEQVLEEERVQVLKEAYVQELEPTEHKRVAEVIEDGVEDQQAIFLNPVDWFRQGKGHTNREVSAIVAKDITPLFQEIGTYAIPPYFTAERISKTSKQPVIDLLNTINRFLVHAMRGEVVQTSKQQQTLLVDILWGMAIFNCIKAVKQYYDSFNYQDPTANYRKVDLAYKVLKYLSAYSTLNRWELVQSASVLGENPFRHGLLTFRGSNKPLEELPNLLLVTPVDLFPHYGSSMNLHLLYPTEQETENALITFFSSYLGNGQFSEKAKKALIDERFYYHLRRLYVKACPLNGQSIERYSNGQIKTPGVHIDEETTRDWMWLKVFDEPLTQQETRLMQQRESPDFRSLPIFEAEHNHYKECLEALLSGKPLAYLQDPVMQQRIQKARNQAVKDVEYITTFTTQWANLAQLLKAEPILERTGQSQPRKRTQITYLTEQRKTINHPPLTITHPRKVIMHPQRSYDDVKAERANELVNLPMSPTEKVARVKIAVNIPENPGKKCPSCGLLDTSGAKKCRQCATLLSAPNEYVISTIKPVGGIGSSRLAQRIQEIQARNIQDGYLKKREDVEAEITIRQARCSQQAQLPPQPSAPQSQPPPIARKAASPCPTCGFSNPQGSKFCNQCGAKL